MRQKHLPADPESSSRKEQEGMFGVSKSGMLCRRRAAASFWAVHCKRPRPFACLNLHPSAEGFITLNITGAFFKQRERMRRRRVTASSRPCAAMRPWQPAWPPGTR